MIARVKRPLPDVKRGVYLSVVSRFYFLAKSSYARASSGV